MLSYQRPRYSTSQKQRLTRIGLARGLRTGSIGDLRTGLITTVLVGQGLVGLIKCVLKYSRSCYQDNVNSDSSTFLDSWTTR